MESKLNLGYRYVSRIYRGEFIMRKQRRKAQRRGRPRPALRSCSVGLFDTHKQRKKEKKARCTSCHYSALL